jgi:hypothetical protein
MVHMPYAMEQTRNPKRRGRPSRNEARSESVLKAREREKAHPSHRPCAGSIVGGKLLASPGIALQAVPCKPCPGVPLGSAILRRTNTGTAPWAFGHLRFAICRGALQRPCAMLHDPCN